MLNFYQGFRSHFYIKAITTVYIIVLRGVACSEGPLRGYIKKSAKKSVDAGDYLMALGTCSLFVYLDSGANKGWALDKPNIDPTIPNRA